jgi:HK97 gp10 family phage protein
MISGKVVGFKSLTKKLSSGAGTIEAAAIVAVQKATLLVHKEAVTSIQKSSGGTPAIRYGPKRVVTVSPPGSPPNSDTGRLAQSVKFEFDDNGKSGFVGSNLKYAAYLEFGTKEMSARPWLAPALEKVNKKIADIFKKEINKGIAKGFGIPNDVIKSLSSLGKSGGKIIVKGKKASKKISAKAKRKVKSAKKLSKSVLKKIGKFNRSKRL